MSAMLQLNRELLDRRNMAVLQTTMQSQRASVLEKQAAELALLQIGYNRAERSKTGLGQNQMQLMRTTVEWRSLLPLF